MPAQNPRYARPEGCRGCSLDQSGFGYVLPSGPPDARLRLIGEAAGWEEAVAGEPFYGSAGGVLSRLCARAGIDRRHVHIANVVSCRPPGDWLAGAPWEDHAISTCRQYLQPVLDQTPHDGVVVPLGAVALASVLNLRGVEGVQVRDFHGCVERVTRPDGTGYWVVPSYHPSHLQRGAMNLLEVVTQDLRLADRISQHGFTRSPSHLVVDPHPDWLRAWTADHLARVRQDPESHHFACDTEFDEKSGGADESEVVLVGASPITRVNGANDGLTGWTVPYREPFISILRSFFTELSALRAWIWMWNKYADLDHLWRAGHAIPNEIVIDAMWLFHYLQSDLPRGLGFVAPMASDFGAWKHWSKIKEREGEYAAADGLQTWRTSMWLLRAAHQQGIWDLFISDWHERDVYVLRPAHDEGTPVNRTALVAFHEELQLKLGRVLERIKTTAAQGVLKPKLGYAKRPKGKICPACDGEGDSLQPFQANCAMCGGGGRLAPQPPASILGKPKKGGGEAKQSYMLEGVKLVEREVEVEARACRGCGAVGVGPKHRCPKPKAPRKRTRRGAVPVEGGSVSQPVDGSIAAPTPDLFTTTRREVRYFWQLPFNPDAPAQILAYLAQQGIAAPVDKKTKRATTNKKALDSLKKQHQDDPFFQLQMDWKAVTKVDSTYAVGTLNRLDADDRIHPTFLPKPSTFRDSCQDPNLQNCVRAGTLIEILRDCSRHPHGVPIEQVRVGDWAHTYTADGQLTLRRVTAVHANGVRPVVRVYWRGSPRRRFVGWVDLTSDHLVQLTTGEWRQAGSLEYGDRVLSIARLQGDEYEIILPTGTDGLREHRWAYEQLHPGESPEHVHHVNDNRRDNRPENLQGLTKSDHFRHHNTGERNANWRSDFPTDPVERRRASYREYRALWRAEDPEGFLKWQRDSKRAWYQANRSKAARARLQNNHEIVRVVPVAGAWPVWDLTIDGTHNYIAGELSVHNCVADKAGPDGLASGFRKCIEARDGIPANRTEAELESWRQRWS